MKFMPATHDTEAGAGALSGTGAGDAERPGPDRRALLGALALAIVVAATLVPFLTSAPPAGLTTSNAPWTDEGFNLGNARNRVLFGRFGTDDVDRSLSNGAYTGIAALVFAVTGPSIPAGRALAVVSVAAAVFLLGWGLARPLGRRGALLAAAALGGCQLLLQYGRLGFVEPMTVALLTGALVLAARAPDRPSWTAGAGAGLLVALAVSVKAIALVPGAAVLGVPLVMGLVRRDRAALRMVAAAVGTVVLTALLWAGLVALPNLDRLRIALRIWPEVHYPAGPAALAGRLGTYLAHSDGALPLAAPLIVAAALGVALLTRRGLEPARRDLLLTGLAWGLGTWGAMAVGSYAPNRYVVPALPGLAVLAGAGLAALAGRAPARLAGSVALVLGLAVAVPGAAAAAVKAAQGGDLLARDQATLAAALPVHAVVYGAYGPTMLFGTDARLVTPWAPAGANVDDPVRRFGVTHVLTDGGDVAAGYAAGPPLATVRWGPHTLRLYEIAPVAPD
jgi:hypothetical protein